MLRIWRPGHRGRPLLGPRKCCGRAEPWRFRRRRCTGWGRMRSTAEAVKEIFAAKERPSWDPLIVHIGDRAMLEMMAAEVDQDAHRLMEAFWPGPLTLLLPKSRAGTGGGDRGAQEGGSADAGESGGAGTIAGGGGTRGGSERNRFGRISPTRAAHVAGGSGWAHRRHSGWRGDDARRRVDGGGGACGPSA